MSHLIKFKRSFSSSVAEQFESSQPTTEQRRGLFVYTLSGRDSGRSGGRSLFGPHFLVRYGGRVVQVGANVALAAPDMVDAAYRWVTSVRQRETWLLLRDGADAIITPIHVQDVLTC